MLCPTAVAEWRERGPGGVPCTIGFSQVMVPTWRVCVSLYETCSSLPPKTYRCIPIRIIVCPFRGDGAMPYRCGCDQVSAKSSASSSASSALPTAARPKHAVHELSSDATPPRLRPREGERLPVGDSERRAREQPAQAAAARLVGTLRAALNVQRLHCVVEILIIQLVDVAFNARWARLRHAPAGSAAARVVVTAAAATAARTVNPLAIKMEEPFRGGFISDDR